MTKKEYLSLSKVHLGMKVYHDDIYNGEEELEVVGLRKNSIELQGDYSGGTHNVVQSDWHPIDGAFRLRKVCEQHEKFGTCTLHNLHCSYPSCEPYV